GLKQKILDDPVKLGSLLVAVIMLLFNIYFYLENSRLTNENLALNKEISDLKKPSILALDYRVEGNTASAIFAFYVTNPSDTEYYVDLTQGTCKSNSSLLSISAPPATNNQQSTVVTDSSEMTIPSNPPQNKIPIPPHSKIQMWCNPYDVSNPVRDSSISLTTCVKLEKVEQPICDDLQILVLRK
ncbi:MAG: hypothetical protein WCT31_04295, partial [Candidatus Micrarchaeia archaeon]